MVRTKGRGARAARPMRQRPEKRQKSTVQQSGVECGSDDEHIADLAADAQEMAEEDDGSLAFLSKAKLPQIKSAHANIQEKENIATQRRREREAMQPQKAPEPEPESEGSTDMEGASDSEDEMPGIDVGSDEEEDEEEDLDDEDLDDEDLDDDDEDDEDDEDNEVDAEDAYLARASKKERRAQLELQRQKERLAGRRLPVRAADGQIVEADPASDDEPQSRAVYEDMDEEEDEEEEEAPQPPPPTSSVTHSTRFGMTAPHDIVLAVEKDPRALVHAREQIASLASQIVGDPEVNIGLLRRLAVFAQTRIEPPPETGEKRKREGTVRVHPYIRQLALLSLLAVFVDILPGYRIRALSEKEQQERVGQDVARRREWEQSIVSVYREYLELLEHETRKESSPLAPVALRCFCTLLTRASHFNFRKNIIAVVVSHLSRREWSDISKQCFDALVTLLQRDNDGEVSLEAVQLLYRMVRERNFLVHANVLDVLAHLRLREELSQSHKTGPMGTAHATAPRVQQKSKVDPRKVRKGMQVHRSKKETKRAKELEAIEQEMREADAAIDVEERERNQSETLKLVFALYFRVLKTPEAPQQLLASALQGIVLFAHHVSVDFFRDLIQVLRTLLSDSMDAVDNATAWHEEDIRASPLHRGTRGALLCIVTAFELLKGQGEALQVDVGDFFVAIYQLLPALSMSTCFEEEDSGVAPGMRTSSESDLLFRALDLGMVKVPRHAVNVSLERTAALVKRLMTAALQWPTPSVLRALRMTHTIIGRVVSVDSRIEALLDTRETVRDGQFDAYARVPENARVLAAGEAAWELFALAQSHANSQVRETAAALLDWNP